MTPRSSEAPERPVTNATGAGVHRALAAVGPRFWAKVVVAGDDADPRTCWSYVGERRRALRLGAVDPADPTGAVVGTAGALAAVAPVAPYFNLRPADGAPPATGAYVGHWAEGRPFNVRRVAWELCGYAPLHERELLPACDDPACCRPSHMVPRALEPGSRKGLGVLAYLIGVDAAAAWALAHPAPDAPAPPPDLRDAPRLPSTRANDATWRGPRVGACVVVRDQRGWHVRCPWGQYDAGDEVSALREALAGAPVRRAA